MKPQKKKKEFNDLLLPIILVASVLPFITRQISYDAGLSGYVWYSDYDIVNDFFSYYRSLLFVIIASISGIILIIYLMLQRGQLKTMKLFIPIGIYAFFVIVSSIFSVNKQITMVGGMAHFESVFVLLSYCCILIYVYQINKTEENYKSIFKAILISLILMCIIGLFQMFGKDLFSFPWMQKMILPRSTWKDLLGNIKSHLRSNSVSLTLFNPNYASVYLAMMIPFLTVQLLPSERKHTNIKDTALSKPERLFCGGVLFILTLLLFKTYSRAGLIALFVSLVVLGCYCRKYLKPLWKQCLLGILFCLFIFIGIDAMNHFRYIHKISGSFNSFLDQEDEKALDNIITNKDHIYMSINKVGINFSLAEKSQGELYIRFLNETGEDISLNYKEKTKTLNWKNYKEVPIYIEKIENEAYIFCIVKGITWRFYRDKEKGYLYVNDFGKPDELKEVKQVGPRTLEDIGSGRGYIWSRSIPLLRDTLLIGKGPDTFPVVFPQSDYVGKANNCKTPYTLIEKPHNFYLMMSIQTGVLSCVAFIAFLIIYLVHSVKLYKQADLSSFKVRMGLGCLAAVISYMVSALFNDSSIQTTPVFIVLLGLGLDINHSIKQKS